MKRLQNIITPLHKKTERDYLERMKNDKAACAEIARKFNKDFWDGDRKYGYGGYKYDGRWEVVVKKLIELFNLQDGASILDVGCGKGFMLYEFKKLLPNAKIKGFDISQYAIENAKEEVRDNVFIHL